MRSSILADDSNGVQERPMADSVSEELNKMRLRQAAVREHMVNESSLNAPSYGKYESKYINQDNQISDNSSLGIGDDGSKSRSRSNSPFQNAQNAA